MTSVNVALATIPLRPTIVLAKTLRIDATPGGAMVGAAK